MDLFENAGQVQGPPVDFTLTPSVLKYKGSKGVLPHFLTL